MKNRLLFLSIILLVPFLISKKPAGMHEKAYVDGELIVQLKPGTELAAADMISAMQSELPNLQLDVIKPLSSDYLNLWLLSFDAAKESDAAVLKDIRSHRYISLAQFNHFTDLRETFPDDSQFDDQWNMHNTGQQGGVVGADVSGPEAWDINSGDGVAASGDTIVIAVIDNGFDLNHVDLNFWKNYNEIPNNSIDDDENGYIDDYHGWSAYNHSGNITVNSHGTHVTGIAAAKGNNGIGVAGVNWNTKVLPIQASSTDESIAVEGYTYAFDMRKLYDETDGQKGAFIVVTNSSFGVNQGQPEDYPIWEMLLDSLGGRGILSAGATANANWDIDEVGDIPTAFDCPWLITVTNTTREDVKRESAGYGATTIDLGAPGSSVWSTVPNAGWGANSGTSMSCPHVAGAVGLMFNAADEAFMNMYFADPAGTALLIKKYILDGVDPLPSLQGITVTGGRLNLFNSIELMLQPGVSVSPTSITEVLGENAWSVEDVTLENLTENPVFYTIDTTGYPSWLSLSATNGQIPAQSTIFFEVQLNTEGLSAGNYMHTINIHIGPQLLQVQVTLITPIVQVSPPEVEMLMNPDMMGMSTVSIYNYKETAVDFTISFEGDPGWVSADPVSGSIPEEGSTPVQLHYDTDGLASGIYTSNMIISYLLYQRLVPVSLYCPPVTVNPENISIQIGPNESEENFVILENVSPQDLPYELSIDDQPAWVDFNPKTGTLESGTKDTVYISMNSIGLEEGDYNAMMKVMYGILSQEVAIDMQLIYFGLDELIAGESLKIYPNPFTEAVTFEFDVEDAANIRLDIYDQSGRLMQKISEGHLNPGTHIFSWDGTETNGNEASKGVYYLKITGNNKTASTKILKL